MRSSHKIKVKRKAGDIGQLWITEHYEFNSWYYKIYTYINDNERTLKLTNKEEANNVEIL